MPTEAFTRYEQLLRRLAALDRVGANDSAEADAIRDLMDDPWQRLTAEEQQQAAALSAQLYDEPNAR